MLVGCVDKVDNVFSDDTLVDGDIVGGVESRGVVLIVGTGDACKTGDCVEIFDGVI